MAYRVNYSNQWIPQNCQQRSSEPKSSNCDNQWSTGCGPSATTNEALMKIDRPPPGVGFVSSSTTGDPIIITCLDGHRTNPMNRPNQTSNPTMFDYTKQHEIYGPQPYHDSGQLNNQNDIIVQASSSIASLPSCSTTMDGYIPNGMIFNQPQIPAPPPRPRNQSKKPKRHRTAISTEQILNLEDEYKKNRYIEKIRRMQLSQMLCINERVIKVWFQNRRMKEKNEKATREEDEDVYEVPYIPPSQSDWVTSNPQQIHGRYQYPEIHASVRYPENRHNISNHGSMMPPQHQLLNEVDSTILTEVPMQSPEIQYGQEII